MRAYRLAAKLALVLAILASASVRADEPIDRKGITYHVVPKDAIPALALPKYASSQKVDYLRDDDRVIAVHYSGEDLAYPTRILDHHEIVNDLVNGNPVLVTYCPLCGSAAAFIPVVNGTLYIFGVSGDLYQSDLLMYDHQTNSLWDQITGVAIDGKAAGTRLPSYPVTYDTWRHWKGAHPNGRVLGIPEQWAERFGYYRVGPYLGYDTTQELWFSVTRLDRRLPNKTRVIGIEARGFYKAYPEDLIPTTRVVHDRIGDVSIALIVDRDRARTGAFEEGPHRFALVDGQIVDERGQTWKWEENALLHGDQRIESFAVIPAFWFAWGAIHPTTEIYR